jgi:hypothetical protein
MEAISNDAMHFLQVIFERCREERSEAGKRWSKSLKYF